MKIFVVWLLFAMVHLAGISYAVFTPIYPVFCGDSTANLIGFIWYWFSVVFSTLVTVQITFDRRNND